MMLHDTMEDELKMMCVDMDLLNRAKSKRKELELRVWRDEERLELMKVDMIC